MISNLITVLLVIVSGVLALFPEIHPNIGALIPLTGLFIILAIK